MRGKRNALEPDDDRPEQRQLREQAHRFAAEVLRPASVELDALPAEEVIIHPMQSPVPVPPGEVIEYAIAMMPTCNAFQKGHSIELTIRNQDDVLSRLGTWGVYMLPFMRTVTHHIHFGNSHLLLPVIPASRLPARGVVGPPA